MVRLVVLAVAAVLVVVLGAVIAVVLVVLVQVVLVCGVAAVAVLVVPAVLVLVVVAAVVLVEPAVVRGCSGAGGLSPARGPAATAGLPGRTAASSKFAAGCGRRHTDGEALVLWTPLQSARRSWSREQRVQGQGPEPCGRRCPLPLGGGRGFCPGGARGEGGCTGERRGG